MPLQRNYRFVFQNKLNASILPDKLTLNARRWKFNSAGSLEFESSESLLYNLPTTLASSGYIATTGQNNSTSGFLGGAFEIYCVATGVGTTGDLICYYETSTDGGTTFDQKYNGTVSNNGRVVSVLSIGAPGTGIKSFRI